MNVSTERKPRVLPLVYLFATILAMTAAHYFVPIVQLLTPPASYIGLILVAAGIGITAVSARAFLQAGTPLIPFAKTTAVVTTGLYRYTRNPMYLGMVIVLLGVAIFLGSVVAFMPIAVFTAIIEIIFIRREEKFLEDLFGDEYTKYRTTVRRWL